MKVVSSVSLRRELPGGGGSERADHGSLGGECAVPLGLRGQGRRHVGSGEPTA